MFRGFRHTVLWLLHVGIISSGLIALAVSPDAWQPILICALGSSLAAMYCGRLARRYLNASIGRLRRVADAVGHGQPVDVLETQPGEDMHKLTAAINLLAVRLADASREEKRLHEELRRRERLAFLGELAASVAHEVNNPLDGVQNCTRILRRSLDDPVRTQQMLDLIDSGLGRIELIVRRLLTLAREHVIRPNEARLSEVITQSVEMIKPRIDGRGIEVVLRLEAADDRTMVDRALLEQAFVNLMLNAADSMPQGGELTIGLRREPGRPRRKEGAGPADSLCVEIRDTGSGIPDDVLPHIFEPFFTTKPGGKGTGLGLAIASRIVDAHDGVIEVTAREGGGTVFTVRVPAVPAEPISQPAADAELTATPAE